LNLFTIALDDERRWFRYHHLFGEALRERLLSGATEAGIATLHRRASAWYEGQGLVVEAVQHALAAQDWERAARLIEGQGLQLMLSGQVHTVLGWLGAIPADFMRQRPILIVHYASGLMFTYQVAAAEARLHEAEHALPPETPDELARLVRGRVALCRGIIGCLVGDLAQALDFLQQAVALLPETTANPTLGIMSARARAATAVYVAATAYQLTGDVTEASEQRTAAAIAPIRTTGYMTETLHSYTSLAYLQVLQGHLRAAAATYAEVERLIPGQDALQALIGSPAYYVGMGELLYEWNNLDAAEGYLARGMELVQGTLATEADVILRGYLALARVQQARGNGEEALTTLDAFMQLARERQLFALLIERAAALRARLQLQQGNLDAALRWAEGSGLAPDDAISFPREAAQLTLARVRIAAGQVEAVVPLLGRLLADAEAKARMHSVIEILTLQALACNVRNQRDDALGALERALILAEPEGYVRSFVDEGAPLAALLRAAAVCSSAPAYVARLLAAFPSSELRVLCDELDIDQAPTQNAKLRTQNVPVEPLSERQLAVLRLMAAGRSNQEIAKQLVITLNTVKKHSSNLFLKLDVTSRTQAIARARDLGLL
jgi:LuxR family maltose regulon positive regulatory protein